MNTKEPEVSIEAELEYYKCRYKNLCELQIEHINLASEFDALQKAHEELELTFGQTRARLEARVREKFWRETYKTGLTGALRYLEKDIDLKNYTEIGEWVADAAVVALDDYRARQKEAAPKVKS